MSSAKQTVTEAPPLAALFTLSSRRRKRMTGILGQTLARRLTFGLAIASVLVLIIGGALGYILRPY